jgi:5-methylcytosine-specific restriction protein A
MATYLLTWNPKKWDWETLDDDLDTFRTEGLWVTSWSCGRRKAIFSEDRVFLIKQGPQRPRGIFASGYVTHGPTTACHFTDRQKQATYVDIEFDVLLDPRADVLPREQLDRAPFASVNWGTQSGGITIVQDVAILLEDIWDKHVRGLGLNPIARQYSSDAEVQLYIEGTRRKVVASRLERSASARAACINAKGVRCLCCRLDFGERYGDFGRGFIHVHHQELLAGGGRRETNPIDDLFPVCPNCHAMLHRSNPPLTIDQLRQALQG